jgi:putative endonuclease
LLCRHGLQVLSRNYNCRGGEIDLVMRDGAVLVFVEVRYRSSDRYGSGADSVTARKQSRIAHAARHFLMRHPEHARRPCRFDVVSVRGEAPEPDGRRAALTWIRAAFEAS